MFPVLSRVLDQFIHVQAVERYTFTTQEIVIDELLFTQHISPPDDFLSSVERDKKPREEEVTELIETEIARWGVAQKL
jgi:hypothetical protein